MLFEAGGAVFIMNLKMRLRNISLTASFKAILQYFGLNSLSGSTVDRCTELKPVSIDRTDRRGETVRTNSLCFTSV